MSTKKPTVTVELTAFEAESMFLAGSNYTPSRQTSSRLRAQSRAVAKLQKARYNAGLMNPIKRPAA